MKPQKLAVILALAIDEMSRQLFKDSEEITISKQHFQEVVSKKVARTVTPIAMKTVKLMNEGLPSFIAAIVAKTEADLGSIKSMSISTLEEHKCEECDAAEGCEIKEVITKLNTLKADSKMSAEEKKERIGELLKEPFKHTGDPSKN